jgi:5-(carboxyamino)imidazole ribonucleotide synthase
VDARTGLPVVGMVGAGQLARMTHQAAIALGQSLRILADSESDGAALIASDVIIGDYRQLTDLREFARGCEVVTFDHEHVPQSHLRALVDDGITVAPGPDALRFAQDKIAMRTKVTELGLAVPAWAAVSADAGGLATVETFGAEHGWPLVIKAATGGYDGRGVWVVGSLDEAAPVLEQLLGQGTAVLLEQRVDIKRELAAVVARSPFGQGAAWPIVETVQRDGICIEVLAPAPGLTDDQADEAEELALRLAGELGVVGVLAVELFEDRAGRLLVNELAMRPHNSGHWTIEGARTSQFEQHLRAVLDYPLGSTELTAPAVVMVNLLGADGDVEPKAIDERVHHFMAHWPDVKLHLYGKGWRPGRKVGHVTALGPDLDRTREQARAAAAYLMNGDAK